MRRLFGCPDIVSLTEKFLMARNFFRIFTENNPVMWDSKTFCIPEAKGLRGANDDCFGPYSSLTSSHRMPFKPAIFFSTADRRTS